MLRRLGASAVLSLVGLAGATLPARADDGWGNTDCSQTPNAGCELTAGSGAADGEGHPGHQQPNGSSGSSTQSGTASDGNEDSSACHYVPSSYQPPAGAVGSGVDVPGGEWLDGMCSTTGVIQTPEYVAALTPAEVALLARKQLRLPAPTIAANPAGEQLVNLPTWMWLSGGWKPVSATASVPGVSVTAIATPTSVTWSMGDGSTETCAGAGTPYTAGTDPEAPSPDCGHVYRRSSASRPRHAYSVTATLHWTVTWSGAGQSGTFPDMTTTGNASFRVAESQALNNGSG